MFEVDPIASSFLTGRTGVRTPDAKLELVIDGVPQPPVALGREREFSVALPTHVFDGVQHEIAVRLAGKTDFFLNSPIRFQSNYQGYVHMEPFAGPLLTGWAVDLARPDTALDIELCLHGRPIATVRADLFRRDLQAAPLFSGRCGFSYTIHGQEQLDRSSVIQARIAGTPFDLRGSPVLYLDTSRFVKTLHRVNSAFRFLYERTAGCARPSGPDLEITEEERRTFADLLLSGGNLAEMMELSRWFQAAGEEHIDAATHRHRFYTYYSGNFAGAAPIRHPSATAPVMDAIFYVRKDAAPARVAEAFRRLMGSPRDARFAVVCVLDVGPESPFDPKFFEAAAPGRELLFLDNEDVLGFPGSINRALALHPDRDVVLGDCETLVPGDWLARLKDAAVRAPAAGIVTPFANGGEICCYPPSAEHALPEGDIDSLCAAANAGKLLDLPAVHGVCALIRRACLDEVGAFDEQVFRSRNASVADFCLRAGTRGWRTVLAADVLVEAPAAPDDDEVYSTTLDHCHPYYGDLLVNFRVDDAALPLRRAIDLAYIKHLGKPVYCFLTHRFGGGTERHVRDLCAALAQKGVECLVIFALDRNRVSCVTPGLPLLASMHYNLETEYEALVSDLAGLQIECYHIHSNLAIPQKLMQLPDRTGVPYYCTIHDYSWFCPRVNLIDNSGVYCGEPSPAACNDCVREAEPGLWREFSASHKNVEELRLQSRRILAAARKVICPSRDTKLRMARQFQLSNLVVRANLEERPGQTAFVPVAALDRARDGTVGVALIGYLSKKKGMEVLRACAEAALRDRVPLRFVVVGFTEDDSSFAELTNVTITGRYKEGEAGSIARRHGLQTSLFPAVCPETFSYTLSIAINCGLYPVAFDLGAIAERIRELRFGHLLPLETLPEEINETLMACSLLSQRRPPQRAQADFSQVLDYYYSDESESGKSELVSAGAVRAGG
jgi:glycosyltransferase involved in cell wall biosynthesis